MNLSQMVGPLIQDGIPTNDPQDMVDGGAMMPLGSERERGGHKGYCLGAMVDLLCGPLCGGNWGPFTPPVHLIPRPH